MVTVIGAIAGALAGVWLGSHPDPHAGRRAQWQSRIITGCIGVLAGAALARFLVPAAMPEWHASIAVIESPAAFDTLLTTASDEPVLVDFFATWCGPCRGMAPNVNAVAASGAQVAVVDVDAQPELALRYGVEVLPTLLVFRDGEVVHREVGYHSESELQALAAQPSS